MRKILIFLVFAMFSISIKCQIIDEFGIDDFSFYVGHIGEMGSTLLVLTENYVVVLSAGNLFIYDEKLKLVNVIKNNTLKQLGFGGKFMTIKKLHSDNIQLYTSTNHYELDVKNLSFREIDNKTKEIFNLNDEYYKISGDTLINIETNNHRYIENIDKPIQIGDNYLIYSSINSEIIKYEFNSNIKVVLFTSNLSMIYSKKYDDINYFYDLNGIYKLENNEIIKILDLPGNFIRDFIINENNIITLAQDEEDINNVNLRIYENNLPIKEYKINHIIENIERIGNYYFATQIMQRSHPKYILFENNDFDNIKYFPKYLSIFWNDLFLLNSKKELIQIRGNEYLMNISKGKREFRIIGNGSQFNLYTFNNILYTQNYRHHNEYLHFIIKNYEVKNEEFIQINFKSKIKNMTLKDDNNLIILDDENDLYNYKIADSTTTLIDSKIDKFFVLNGTLYMIKDNKINDYDFNFPNTIRFMLHYNDETIILTSKYNNTYKIVDNKVVSFPEPRKFQFANLDIEINYEFIIVNNIQFEMFSKTISFQQIENYLVIYSPARVLMFELNTLSVTQKELDNYEIEAIYDINGNKLDNLESNKLLLIQTKDNRILKIFKSE